MVWWSTPSMELAEIEKETRTTLPDWEEAHISMSVIEKGGSGRVFVRMRNGSTGRNVIAMHYSNDRSDNARFASITDFLNRHEIPAPAIYGRNEDRNLLWVEDLGEIDLGNLDGQDWETVRRPAYHSALRTVFLLHRITEEEAPEDLPELELSFDEALYEWEQDYFLNQYVKRFVSEEVADHLRRDTSLKALRCELAGLPRALLHRDFQSTNVMVSGTDTFLIDYQGLRWGLPEYDLASLVYDPYTVFTPEEREDLITYYFSLKREKDPSIREPDFRRLLTQCAFQRLMQAMGAYGFLSEVKGMKDFLNYIPTARKRLVALAREDGGLPVLGEVLGE